MTWKNEKKFFEKEIRPGGRRAETPKKTADKPGTVAEWSN